MNRPTQPHPLAQTPLAEDAARGRREPTFDRMDEIEFRDPDVGGSGHASGRSRRWWPWLLAMCAIVILGAWLLRQPLGDRLWPQTRAQELRAEAAAALARGHLTAADGSGARERYEAALAIDPDRTEARAGLMRVAHAALAQARTAIAARHFEQAHQALRLARELSVPRAQADAVATELRLREAAHAGIDALLAKARIARVAGRLDGDEDAALPLYRRVLELQPERIDALEGREDALGDLLQQARQGLDRGELSAPAAAIAAAGRYDSGHTDLPESRARLARALEQARRRADADLRAGRLQRAVSGYRELLQADDGNDATKQGLTRTGLAYAAHAARAAADFRFADAQAALLQAQALAPAAAAVRDAETSLQRARRSQATLQSTLRQPALSPRQRERRVAQLLVAAAAAEARGDLLAPPGDSAYDKLRAARILAPDSSSVRRAAARLLPAAEACFERELRGNNLARARACLDARAVLDGNDDALAQARRRLAQRWLAVGDERLGAGEIATAASALNAARGLDGATPGLKEFAERVRTASAGHR